MLILKKLIIDIKAKFALEKVLNALVIGVIGGILVVSMYALLRPVTAQQYVQVQRLAQQQGFAATQVMALQLLQQPQIRSHEFYRLMHAQHFESAHLNVYPALSDQVKKTD